MLSNCHSAFLGYRFISFYEALRVNSAVTHLMGFLLLFATVRVWDLLRHHAQLQVINKTLTKAWDEVLGFILIIMILLSSYAMTVSPKAQHLPQGLSPVCSLRKGHCSETIRLALGFLRKGQIGKLGLVTFRISCLKPRCVITSLRYRQEEIRCSTVIRFYSHGNLKSHQEFPLLLLAITRTQNRSEIGYH